jgi:3-hydroxy-9,10-secoandrosta-1,3,5(10)-triene-9,17-dione monooxygenase reductase component
VTRGLARFRSVRCGTAGAAWCAPAASSHHRIRRLGTPASIPPLHRLALVADFDAETYRAVLRRFATGVAVVTTWDADRPWGTTVNSFSSVSLRPPLVLVAFDHGRRIAPALRATGRYAVNILGEDQQSLSDCFAGGPAPASTASSPSGPVPVLEVAPAPGRGELCGAAWRRGPTGLPVLVEAIACLECTIVDVHPAGDHHLYIARVDAASAVGEQPMPLLYYSGRYLRIERASTHDLVGKPEL